MEINNDLLKTTNNQISQLNSDVSTLISKGWKLLYTNSGNTTGSGAKISLSDKNCDLIIIFTTIGTSHVVRKGYKFQMSFAGGWGGNHMVTQYRTDSTFDGSTVTVGAPYSYTIANGGGVTYDMNTDVLAIKYIIGCKTGLF